jgi:tRNA dimethylallyltransferase
MPAELIAIAGPTAVGKSAVALDLARRLDGEIISVDSMQVYRGMDIGTAKPSRAERQLVPHHLIDILNISEAFDAAQFVQRARAAVADVRDRGRIPIFCGGTGLYFKAFLEGLGEAPPADPEIRAELEGSPLKQLLTELEQRDPATFAVIDKRNPRRVIRAVEVIRLTGRPFSEQRALWSKAQVSADNPKATLVVLARKELQRRIDERVDRMFREGLVAETERLLKSGLDQNEVAMQALGYRQVCDHLEGELDLKETVELVKLRTRQFAKRQLTWFRRQPAKWIELDEDEQPGTTVERLCAFL